MTTLSKRASEKTLADEEVRQFVAEAASQLSTRGKRVLVIIPDSTRTMPMPLMFELLQAEIGAHAAACDYLVALGTHAHMDDAQLGRMLGRSVVNGICEGAKIFNHRWDIPETFADIGVIDAADVARISRGVLSEAIRIHINRLIFDYDHVLICGPVFPHEVVGFSGGNKYLFPGVSTGEMIHQTHWLGALLGSYNIIGTGATPVRELIDLAAAKVSVSVSCFALVLKDVEIAGIYFGAAKNAWSLAAAHSSETHIQWVERPFRRVLAVIPEMYPDLWTGAKGMYKSDPAIADGGEVVLYAPHINQASYIHGDFLAKVGYHCAEHFLKQPKRFAHIPRGILAHSIHLYGQGLYDAVTGYERPRIHVTLATSIPQAQCSELNLGYLDYRTINLEDWRNRESEGIKLIPHAGEILYRVKSTQKTTHAAESLALA
ncbi:MAG: lactate racemase domain-containing protein [Terriglobales bacterium]